jgi:hypothetical protein
MPSLLQDLLKDELLDQNKVRIVVRDVFSNSLVDPDFKRVTPISFKTPEKSTSLSGFYDLVYQAINNYESRSNISDSNKIVFTEEEPDVNAKSETITFSLLKREPGAFSQGAPFEGNIKNLRPMFREEGNDKDNPGYRYMVLGYKHDNLVRFTCWARTNKQANFRAEWFEGFMEEYAWFFKAQGIERVLFQGRSADIVTEINGNKWYGRPLDFFVRTESIRIFTEKAIEEILVNLKVQKA